MIFLRRLHRLGSYFYLGFLLKIFLGSLLASYFLTDLFVPFLNYFVSSGFQNPYNEFFDQGRPEAFPYPALMLYIMSFPKWLLGWLGSGNGVTLFDLFLYRIPLLVADLVILVILCEWLPKLTKKIIWFYWLSPVLIYISYIHGQLDVIPIALLFVSLHFLFKEKFYLAALFLGLAFSAKTHVLLVVPFYLLYLVSQGLRVKRLSVFFGVFASVFWIVNLPYLFGFGFWNMVFLNREQAKVFDFGFPYGNDLYFYLIPAALLGLFVNGALLRRYNRNVFIMFLGFAFSVTLLFIAPMPGWYFWLIPFLVYFYIKEKGRSPMLFWGLQAFYLLFFGFSQNSDYFQVFKFLSPELSARENFYSIFTQRGFDMLKFKSMIFTFLQATLLVNCVWVYRKGVQSYRRHKIASQPYLLGIGGDSGVGKTTLSGALEGVFRRKNVTIIRGDDMHKWERGHEKWEELTHLDPKANQLHQEIHYLSRLKQGMLVRRRHYDHDTGKFTEEELLKPASLIVFEGLHPFYLSRQRHLYDLKIFIKPEKELMLHWKLSRDTKKRGYTKDKVIEQIKRREKDSDAYVLSQLKHADIVIEPFSQGIDSLGSGEAISTFFRVKLPNSVFIESLIEELQSVDGLDIEHEYQADDTQIIQIGGCLDRKVLSNLTAEFIPGLQDIGINTPVWPEDAFGVLVFILSYYIFEESDYGQ